MLSSKEQQKPNLKTPLNIVEVQSNSLLLYIHFGSNGFSFLSFSLYGITEPDGCKMLSFFSIQQDNYRELKINMKNKT